MSRVLTIGFSIVVATAAGGANASSLTTISPVVDRPTPSIIYRGAPAEPGDAVEVQNEPSTSQASASASVAPKGSQPDWLSGAAPIIMRGQMKTSENQAEAQLPTVDAFTLPQ